MGFIYYGEQIKIVSTTKGCRLDIGSRAMKQDTPGSLSSWATRLIIKRLDGLNEGKVEESHDVGIFSENDLTRLDVSSDSMKEEVPIDSETWATVLKLTSVTGEEKKGEAVKYGDTVGVFSSVRDNRLDIGSGALKQVSSSHESWATCLHIQKVTFNKVSATELFKKEWPETTIEDQFYVDRKYYGIPTNVAQDIWANSGLRNYNWTSESFDCDDFSYVYKAAVSKHVYEKKVSFPYAVGILFGSNDTGGHAVNIFLDEYGDVKILEPQNGKIIDGKDWDYNPHFILM
mmetsp:Transcript_13278/g.17364  ORF Transcript_13278/g.17364 Transcript_13278/m.17364 type:complete len:288 (-) Transcript_13278:112-975(-)|eukprot:CAMPEP_0198136998 /NCGR_PEP_ID=MMETSP1443-20131203/546_1 /TAXON_ID=186043 /ORGANISM="Entomoneis sp., Strain CCMP2396" /LENGTH=287 /DNA_ID=CAMNT_0043798311 /DNA_START=116 /DNA_END=979 /DNA_ORIENTATION=-